MALWPTQGDEKRLGPAITFYGTAALPFVIPSEAEGSAVLRTCRGNVFDRAYPDFLPRRTRNVHYAPFRSESA
jgi:hypothetical protein